MHFAYFFGVFWFPILGRSFISTQIKLQSKLKLIQARRMIVNDNNSVGMMTMMMHWWRRGGWAEKEEENDVRDDILRCPICYSYLQAHRLRLWLFSDICWDPIIMRIVTNCDLSDLHGLQACLPVSDKGWGICKSCALTLSAEESRSPKWHSVFCLRTIMQPTSRLSGPLCTPCCYDQYCWHADLVG